jgi:hypothetical protein
LSCSKYSRHSGHPCRPCLWMDCTGDHLRLYHADTDWGDNHFRVPFDLTLSRSDLGPDEVYRAMAEASKGQGVDRFTLTAFHRYLPLMADQEPVLNLLWRCFFQSIKGHIGPVPQQSAVTALIPTAWSPQVAASLAFGFSDVFGIIPSFCTTAVVALFNALTEMQAAIASQPVGHQEDFSQSVGCGEDTSSGETFVYRMKKHRSEVLNLQLTDWQYDEPLPASPPEAGDAGSKSITAGEAFSAMLAWMDRTDSPRIDLGMDFVHWPHQQRRRFPGHSISW